MTVCYIAASYTFHSMTIHSPFVRYHTKQCAKIVLRPDEDSVSEDEDIGNRFHIMTRTTTIPMIFAG